jgi:hypothetical protein
MSDIFKDFARDFFGVLEVPDTIPLKVLGLMAPMPSRAAIQTAFRRRAIEVHPDLQLAYDHPVLQPGADDALGAHPAIRELVWARDVLLERAFDPDSSVTGNGGVSMSPRLSVTPQVKVCRKCHRELLGRESYAVGALHSRRARWCWRCVQADDAERAKERRRRRRANRRCAVCTTIFTPSRSDGRHCSPRCRQMAYRCRVTANRRNRSVTTDSRNTSSPNPQEARP